MNRSTDRAGTQRASRREADRLSVAALRPALRVRARPSEDATPCGLHAAIDGGSSTRARGVWGVCVADRAATGMAATLLAAMSITAAGFAGREAPRTVATAALEVRFDPNTATAAELSLLPGIGPALAKNIVAYRESVHPATAFRTPEDLDAVARIGPITIERLRPFLLLPARPEDDRARASPPVSP